MQPPSVAIIGAGPAGLMAAERLAELGAAVTILDHMPSPGRKFLLAGRGGLNLTHTEPPDRFLARYGPAAPFLRPAIEAFPPAALRAWCEGLGVPTFVGSSGRVFPVSLKASPLLRAWLRRLQSQGVTFRPGHRWLGWDAGSLLFETRQGRALLRPDATLLALGGASWPRLGADGAWTTLLAARGLPIAPLRPANAGVTCAWSDHFRTRFAGAPLKRLSVSLGDRTARGEAVITETGLEGGAIYALSSAIRDALERDGAPTLLLDLRPDLDEAALRRRLGGPSLSRANAWRRAGLSPAAAGLLRECGGEPKRVAVAVTGLSPLERAISTAGGLSLAALDENFMLRTHPGIFAAGEMLDWDAPTGGYLLQACFSTARAAAEAILTYLHALPSPSPSGATGFTRPSGPAKALSRWRASNRRAVRGLGEGGATR